MTDTIVEEEENLLIREAPAFEHPLVAQQDSEIHSMSLRVQNILKEDQTNIVTCTGTMGVGKTSIAILACNQLIESGRRVHIFSLADGRNTDSLRVYNRKGIKLNSRVNPEYFEFQQGAANLIDKINSREISSGDTVFLLEAQFSGDVSTLSRLVNLCKERNINLVCDCLSTWFTGKPIAETLFLESMAGVNSMHVYACDSFDPNRRAHIPIRVVKIYEDGNLHDPEDSRTAHYYRELDITRRGEIYLSARSNPYSTKLCGSDMYGNYILVPSHPTRDEKYVPGGNERYFPSSLETCLAIARSAGLDEVANAYVSLNGVES